MPWETPQNTLDTNMTKAILADNAYERLAALMKELAAEGSAAASQFTEGYERLHVAHGPYALALALGAMSEAITDLRARTKQLETT
jgi:hypothetical protein